MRVVLDSDKALYQFLVQLSDQLRQAGEAHLADTVKSATWFATGSSSEFYFEAEKALRCVQQQPAGLMSRGQLADVEDVLKQIDEAFRRIGGA